MRDSSALPRTREVSGLLPSRPGDSFPHGGNEICRAGDSDDDRAGGKVGTVRQGQAGSREKHAQQYRIDNDPPHRPREPARDGRRKRVVLSAAAFPHKLAPQLTDTLLGIQVDNLTASSQRKYQTHSQTGVVITHIRKTAHLYRIGARPGDVIRQIDEISVENRDAFEKAIIKYRLKSSVVVLLQRANQLYNVTVDLL